MGRKVVGERCSIRGLKARRKAFSLVELIIVMIIVGIMIGVAIPEVVSTIREAKMDTLNQNMRAIRRALDQYYRDKGHYPHYLTDLTKRPDPYFRELPINPFTHQADWLVCDWKQTGVWMTQNEWKKLKETNESAKLGSFVFDIKPSRIQ